jgi:hypothetical protein
MYDAKNEVADEATVLNEGFLKGEGSRLSFVHGESVCCHLPALIVAGLFRAKINHRQLWGGKADWRFWAVDDWKQTFIGTALAELRTRISSAAGLSDKADECSSIVHQTR